MKVDQDHGITKSEETSSPRMPPRWIVHGAWRVHRGLHKLSGGRFLWPASNKRGWGAAEPKLDGYAGTRSTKTPAIVLEPRQQTEQAFA